MTPTSPPTKEFRHAAYVIPELGADVEFARTDARCRTTEHTYVDAPLPQRRVFHSECTPLLDNLPQRAALEIPREAGAVRDAIHRNRRHPQ